MPSVGAARPLERFFASPAARDETLFWLVGAIVTLILLSAIFAGLIAALRFLNTRRARRRRGLEETWEPLVLAVLSGDDSALSRIRVAVSPGDARFFLEFLHRFRLRLSGAGLGKLTLLAGPFLEALSRSISRGDALARARALDLLGSLDPARARLRMISALEDPSDIVVLTAARHLSRKFDEVAFARALTRLGGFRHFETRSAATLLSSWGMEGAPFLRARLLDSRAPSRERVIVAMTLGELRDNHSADAAAEALDAPDREVRAAALRLLQGSALPEHAPAIRAFLASPDPVLRSQAALALGSIGLEEDHAALAAIVEEGQGWSALNAAWALLRAGGRKELERIARESGRGAVHARQALAEPGR